jgi:hypothetical protein
MKEAELHVHEELPDSGHEADSVGGHQPSHSVHFCTYAMLTNW